MNRFQPNNLQRRFQEITAMKSIQNNPMLNLSSRRAQQTQQRDEKREIKQIILDQRKTDPKIDKNKFDRIINNINKIQVPERERYWATRTNQPYKTIFPAEEIKKKEYKTKEDLVVYVCKEHAEDKDEKVFKENTNKLKKAIEQHEEELKNKYPETRKEEYKKEFDYNHIEKYNNIKYDPADFKDMKDGIVEHFKKAQLEEEKNKENVDNILEAVIGGGITNDEPVNLTQPEQTEQLTEQKSEEPDESIDSKYEQRQKKV